VFSGKSPDGKFIEIVELADHPWFLGCQFHPEFKSKPLDPHPLFVSFIQAAYRNRIRDEATADRDGSTANRLDGMGEGWKIGASSPD